MTDEQVPKKPLAPVVAAALVCREELIRGEGSSQMAVSVNWGGPFVWVRL